MSWKDDKRKSVRMPCIWTVYCFGVWSETGLLKGPWSWLYLVLLCSRGESVDLWAQLNKHLCDSPDPGMKSSVFIVLGTEVVLILLPLLQCFYGTVFSEKKQNKPDVISKQKWSFETKLFPIPSSRWHCRTVEWEAWHVTDLTAWCVDQM